MTEPHPVPGRLPEGRRIPQPRPDQARPGQPLPDQSGPGQSHSDQPGLGQSRSDQPGPGQSRSDQPRYEQSRADQPRSEQPRPDQPRPEQNAPRPAARPPILEPPVAAPMPVRKPSARPQARPAPTRSGGPSTTQPLRHADRGRIDRSRRLWFRFGEHEFYGHPGDTLASALLANGVREIGRSVNLDRPRGLLTAGPEEPNGLVQLYTPVPRPMVAATMVELYDGLVAGPLSGRGWLGADLTDERTDAVWAHCDVLVIGAGAAGRSAAGAAARDGARVLLIDERPPGPDEIPAPVRTLPRTTAIGCYDGNLVLAVQRRTAHLGPAAPPAASRERLWRIRAGRIVLATGAYERPIPFPDNDRPGVMLVGAARAYLDRYGVLPGTRAIVHVNNDLAMADVRELATAGVEIVAVADTRMGERITAVYGEERVTGARVGEKDLGADCILVSGGYHPALHLYGQAGGRLRFDEPLGAFVADGARPTIEVVGAAAGENLPTCGVPRLPGESDEDDRIFLDQARDVTVADVRRAVAAGLRSVEHVKRYTTAGTGPDQGKTSAVLTASAVASALGVPIAEVGTTSFRPPTVPVAFATLAGRDRGDLFDPIRTTVLHDWHAANGAVFTDDGAWKRPAYYRRHGEDAATAITRECRTVRGGVALHDASTLGKIDVAGPDAGEFLDRLYTGVMSTLPVGAVRYGVLCRLDGTVFDDGTVARLADDRYLVTTTTGGADEVLDWMERWLQVEWPDLRVWCTSVTEQWATLTLAGPRSREVLTRLAPPAGDLAAQRWRPAQIAGVTARVFRISFSGELAFEVNVPAWSAPEVWTALLAAGADVGIAPYGTEAVAVLRAEKGYPVVGQETDGTVNPDDLGLARVIRRSRKDFVGRRSLSRPDALRADRKHLVALLTEDPAIRLPEGAPVIASLEPTPEPQPCLGHVTSSYASPTLGRTFALALVAGGRFRIGEIVYAGVDGEATPVRVAEPVLYDPEGARRDG